MWLAVIVLLASQPAQPPQSAQLNGLTLTPTVAGVARYGDPVASPRETPLVAAIVKRITTAAGKSRLRPDPTLFLAATEIARVAPEDSRLPQALADFALQHFGNLDPSPALLTVFGRTDRTAHMLESLEQIDLPRAIRGHDKYGIGVSARAVVLAFQRSQMTLAPVPRALPKGGTVQLDGTLDAALTKPVLYVTYEDGTGTSLPLAAAGRRIKGVVDCGAHRGTIGIEITASGPLGPAVLVNFPVACNEGVPTTRTAPLRMERKNESEDAAAKRMFELVNRDRRAAQLPPLAWNDAVADVARAHCKEMRETGDVGHHSKRTGRASDRIERAGIKSGLVVENIASEGDVDLAQAALMGSPGHRTAILSVDVTDVGIGVVQTTKPDGRPGIIVTQVFIRVPKPLNLTEASKALHARLIRERSLEGDDVLDRVAREEAEALRGGASADGVLARAQPRLDSYKKLGGSTQSVTDLAAIGFGALPEATNGMRVGIGLAQGTHKSLGPGALWVVLISAVPK